MKTNPQDSVIATITKNNRTNMKKSAQSREEEVNYIVQTSQNLFSLEKKIIDSISPIQQK